MKKISLIILSLFLCNQMAISAIDTSLCAQKPYDVSNKFSQITSNIFGTNFMTTKIVELALQSQIRKDVGAKGANVEIIPYSAGDFISGKYKSIYISIPRAHKNDIAFSNFKAQSLCDFNHVIVDKKDIKFAQNFLMNFSFDFTNDDLNKIITSEKYLEKVADVKVKIGNFSLLRVVSPTYEIKNGKLEMSFGIETPLLYMNKVDKIVISSQLKANNGKIELANILVNSKKYDASLLLPIINLLNPLSFKSDFANNMGIAQIRNVDIIEDKISVSGLIYIPKNYVMKK